MSHLRPDDVSSEFLLDHRSFEDKLLLLSKVETIDKEAEAKIRNRQRKRNDLFRKDGHLMVRISSDDVKMKEQMLQSAFEAFDACQIAVLKRFNLKPAGLQELTRYTNMLGVSRVSLTLSFT